MPGKHGRFTCATQAQNFLNHKQQSIYLLCPVTFYILRLQGTVCTFCIRDIGRISNRELHYLGFPCAHHRGLRTNSVQKRANRKLKHFRYAAEVFPSRQSRIHMLGVVFSEMNKDCQGGG